MEDKEIAQQLKQRGLTCPRLNSMINKQISDAKKDVKDSQKFRSLGFDKQAQLQEKIANAQKQSASELKSLYSRVCRKI